MLGQGFLCASEPCACCLCLQVTMGRGDKRTAKGKRKAQSHGNCRPTNGHLRHVAAAKAAAAPAASE